MVSTGNAHCWSAAFRYTARVKFTGGRDTDEPDSGDADWLEIAWRRGGPTEGPMYNRAPEGRTGGGV